MDTLDSSFCSCFLPPFIARFSASSRRCCRSLTVTSRFFFILSRAALSSSISASIRPFLRSTMATCSFINPTKLTLNCAWAFLSCFWASAACLLA
ncbi:hypothetical protein EYF80_046017 [Liparis tanakae]|uniref:Uncharacterized protein n=1 Tax=Liparis tanakae TaxID=230148 RepID=A0A4Z2FSF8_9TELE|nr:hypothetical protein EYF80_046017 [Liparis tanakae]